MDCAEGIGLWVYRRLSATAPQQRDKMWSMYIAGEYGGMNESLARLYQITGKTEFREAAAMFDNTPVFDGLARGLDTISGLHANQHIPQMIGALQEFITTREPHYYQTARNFWELVTSHYAYSTGGVGRGENFKEPDILAGNIEGSRNCETCAAYNMLKLTGMLSFYDPQDSRLMDYYERTLYNQIAASQNPIVRPDAHHGVTYMLPIGPGAVREYSNDYDDFTCCHGTGMENHVRYTEHIYHAGADGSLYIQLYLSSSLYWEEKGITLTQKTDFPSSFSVFIPDRNARLKLFFRIPFWCREDFCICVNDIPQPFVRTAEATPLYDTFCGADSLTGQSGGYALLEGDFAGGDRITVHMPCRLHLCYTPDPLEGLPAASLMYGPLVMAALHPGTDWITLNLPPVTEDAFVMKKKAGIPVLWYDDLPFVPMYAAHNTPYHTYFKINLL
ncbi:MAG: beta-L-arabinofuranosidase domain-containing protein [Eisenbergiella sp.]